MFKRQRTTLSVLQELLPEFDYWLGAGLSLHPIVKHLWCAACSSGVTGLPDVLAQISDACCVASMNQVHRTYFLPVCIVQHRH